MAIIKKIRKFIYIACNIPLVLVCSEQQIPATPGIIAAAAQLVMLGEQAQAQQAEPATPAAAVAAQQLMALASTGHAPGGKSYTCPVCHAIIQGYDEFQRHKRTHKDLPFRCTFPGCDYAAEFRCNLKRHEKMHTQTEERPYGCDRCGKSFRQLRDLTEHKKTHSEERPHVCDQCGKGFAKTNHLTVHMRIHTGERPYVCWCGKGFTVAGHLKDHESTHTATKKRPYACDQCSKRFTALRSLRYHQKKSHPDPMMILRLQDAVQALIAISSQGSITDN